MKKSSTRHRGAINILIIEDDTFVLDALNLLLDSWGFQVLAAPLATAAEREMEASGFRPNLVLSDLMLEGGFSQSAKTAFDILPPLLKRIGFTGPVILMTGDTSPNCRSHAQRLGWSYMVKPVHPQELRSTIAESLLVNATKADGDEGGRRRRRTCTSSCSSLNRPFPRLIDQRVRSRYVQKSVTRGASERCFKIVY